MFWLLRFSDEIFDVINDDPFLTFISWVRKVNSGCPKWSWKPHKKQKATSNLFISEKLKNAKLFVLSWLWRLLSQGTLRNYTQSDFLKLLFYSGHPVRKWKWKAKNRASSNSSSQGFMELPRCQNKKRFFFYNWTSGIIPFIRFGMQMDRTKKFFWDVKSCIFYSYPTLQ